MVVVDINMLQDLFICRKCNQPCKVNVTNYATGSGWGSDDWKVIYEFKQECMCMGVDQLAKALYDEQVRYFKTIHRYDADYDIPYENTTLEQKDVFKNFAAFIVTHKLEIFNGSRIETSQTTPTKTRGNI